MKARLWRNKADVDKFQEIVLPGNRNNTAIPVALGVCIDIAFVQKINVLRDLNFDEHVHHI